MSPGFTDIHDCDVVHPCANTAVAYAKFRGSLSLVCGLHIRDVDSEYDADFYTSDGEAFEI